MLLCGFNLLNFEPTSSFSVQSVPQQEFYRLNTENVKKNPFFLALNPPPAHFILIPSCCFLGRDIPCSPLYATQALETSVVFPSFFLNTESTWRRLNTWLLCKCQNTTESRNQGPKNLCRTDSKGSHTQHSPFIYPSSPFLLRATHTCTEVRSYMAKQQSIQVV